VEISAILKWPRQETNCSYFFVEVTLFCGKAHHFENKPSKEITTTPFYKRIQKRDIYTYLGGK